jgi:hypothetical protein
VPLTWNSASSPASTVLFLTKSGGNSQRLTGSQRLGSFRLLRFSEPIQSLESSFEVLGIELRALSLLG